jgi:centromeric protein E
VSKKFGTNVARLTIRTRLLQPSLSGDALISVICTISPSYLNQAESLSTLSFASGLKRVLLRAQRKELVDPQALIQQYQNEIAELRALIREKGIDGTGSSGIKGQENEPLFERLQELKSRILTSSNIHEDNGENVCPS